MKIAVTAIMQVLKFLNYNNAAVSKHVSCPYIHLCHSASGNHLTALVLRNVCANFYSKVHLWYSM